MKKRIVALMLALLSLFALVSCGKGDLPEGAELPEGMQYAGGAPYGFYLYVPEEWTLSSIDDVVSAFVSTLDLSSVSMTRLEKPTGVDIDGYFKATMEDMPFENYTLLKDGVERTFGTANNKTVVKGKSYEYTYSYKPYKSEEAQQYRVLQIFVEYEGRLYAFTYTALDEKKSEDKTYFATYIDKVDKIIESVQFVSPAKINEAAKDYEKDGDGYLNVASKRLSGFDFYMHPDWECTLTGGIVEAVSPDGKASLNITESKDNGVSPTEYFAKRKSDLERYTGEDITVIHQDKKSTFGDADTAWSYEYTYTYRGKTYHTYQVLIVDEIIPAFYYKGYVFTFTATEDSYPTHIESVNKMIAKVDF